MNSEEDQFEGCLSPGEGKIRVLLVDDHTSIRQMLAFILPREGPYEIVGQVSNGREAIARCRELQPRLVVLDLHLPEVSGVEVVRQIRRELRDTRMLVYSGTTSGALIAEAMSERPHGFVHKEDSLQVFRDALRAVVSGRSYFTQVATESAGRSGDALVSVLTERERVVLQLVAQGCTTKEIAEKLGMAPKTVETHRSNLCGKLDIHDVATLTRFAVRHGLVSID